MPTVASWFSGAGGMDLGLLLAGWRAVSFSEIEPFPSAVLASRWPGVPNLGDIVGVHGHTQRGSGDARRNAEPHGGQDEPRLRADWQRADLWAGGPPCQDLSVAGKRRGLAGERSGLALVWFDLVERYRPPAVLLENVPGLLSSHGGRDLATLYGRLEDLGYVVAHRTLDARFFGVPQRRRRVFLLAVHARVGLGADGPGEILAVGTRCRGHLAAGGEAGPGTAAGTSVGALSTGLGHHGGAWGDQEVAAGHLVANALRSSTGGPDDNRAQGGHLVIAPTLLAPGPEGGRRDKMPIIATHPTLRSGGHGDPGIGRDGDEQRLLALPSGVRRLTPVECERLQGWPDGWTIPNEWKGKRYDGTDLLPLGLDSHRYRAIGNGVAAPVAEWIGARLLAAYEAERVA